MYPDPNALNRTKRINQEITLFWCSNMKHIFSFSVVFPIHVLVMFMVDTDLDDIKYNAIPPKYYTNRCKQWKFY